VANNPSAAKRNRQRIRRRARNRMVIGKMRSALKNARAAITSSQGDASTVIKQAVRLIDKAVTKGVIRRTTASRTISRLTRASQKQ
jgi:small subunit ribosomal protein S20